MVDGQFFSLPENRDIISNAAIVLKKTFEDMKGEGDDRLRFMLNLIAVTLWYIKSRPDNFDQNCMMNIEAMGDRYVSTAAHFSAADMSDVEFMFSTSYRFLTEYQLSSKEFVGNEILSLLSQVHSFTYDGITYSQLRYAEHQMLIDVVRKYIHHPDMVAIKDLPSLIKKGEGERHAQLVDLDAREARVVLLKERLDTYKTAFNFFGLYDGFSKLHKTKKNEARVGLSVLIALGVVMIFPFLAKFYAAFLLENKFEPDNTFYVTLFGFELVLAYFFRVALHHYRSVKAQLVQLDLRMALCQFVQEYAKYAKEVKAESPGILDKFDSVVFSGIVNDESALPSTFDGLEQLSNLIEKIKR